MIKAIILGISVLLFSGQIFADNYKIDPVHTSVIFKVNHLGFSNVFGRFGDVSGFFSIENKKETNNKIELNIKTKSVSTFDEKRDKHLRGPDFFNAKQFPKISFKSTSVKPVANSDKFKVAGVLKMHGKEKNITFEIKKFRSGNDPWGNYRTGGETTFTIKRSDYSMNYMQGENMLSDEIEIVVSLEGIREKK